MTSNLLFDFIVDKENKTVLVTREFAAKLSHVWNAWTQPELLDQWWAPKPYQTKTKSMDFREGGRWLYSMESPEGIAHWCLLDYKKIDVLKSYSGIDAFCDENGHNAEEFPNAHWTNKFTENGDHTTVNISISYKSLSDLEKVIEMGFKEGFSMAMGNLDEYFAKH